ncbi:MAG TPA: hypothetical protein VFI23_06615 [Rhizomicrobium sp.]|nr:hypothetical protein [Rhizomicrobium sp.]
MKQSVLVVGHADADGHLIAEQVRRNLALIPNFEVTAVVDPDRTKDHKAWTKLDSLTEIEDADWVFFVDMMFAPSSFVEEAGALVEFVEDRKDKRFFLIDHHPLPLRRLAEADNLRVMYRPEVFDCAIGPRSGMMVVAAICEGQKANVAEIKEPVHDVMATAVRRAAALGGPLPGEKLSALIRSDRWADLLELGQEDKELHRLPRGRRSLKSAQSKALKSLERIASGIIAEGVKAKPEDTARRKAMAYDIDIADARFVVEGDHRRRQSNVKVQPRDLETILTILEIAAMSLTTSPNATFSREQLIREAKKIGGDEIDLREDDINIVLAKQGFLKRVNARELRLR